MRSFTIVHILVCFLFYLTFDIISSSSNYNVNAKLTVLNGKHKGAVYDTADFFSRMYPPTDVQMMYFAGCTTGKLITQVILNYVDKLASLGYPPAKVLIIPNLHGSVIWDAEIVRYWKSYYIDDINDLASMTIITTDVDPFHTVKPIPIDDAFVFIAEHDSGTLNKVFMLSGLRHYKWLCFALLSIALLYACARIVMLIRLRKLRYNLLLFTLLLLSHTVYVSIILLHLSCPFLMRANGSMAYSFLSKILFDLVLIHWSIIGGKLFSKPAIIIFRSLIGLDIVEHMIILALRIKYTSFDVLVLAGTGGKLAVKYYLAYTSYIVTASSFLKMMTMKYTHKYTRLTFLYYFLIAVWFGRCAYKLKHHKQGYFRFIQLACFCAASLLTCIVFAVYAIASLEEIARIDALYDAAYTMRGLILLTTHGVRWPNREESRRQDACLNGMTTANCEIVTETSSSPFSTTANTLTTLV
ncbi:hypothetical protein BDF22DRAFT_695079 [Syncephalis plumigaleata]|nr:hypothetical protein BDF22DRAFT_695079 [Syncephalis plumigaleata]